MAAVIGRVNSVAVSLFNNAEIGTMLFLGGVLRHERVWAGENEQPPVTVDMKFTQKRVWNDDDPTTILGHNYFWIPEAGRYEQVLINGNPPYRSGNINSLWS
jgi:hypothetical protein